MIASSSKPDLNFTTDAFHRGDFFLIQPAKGTHRAGIDAMLLAACVPDDGIMSIADFGAGAGAAGLAVASRCKQAHITLVERDPLMLECATKTLALKQNKHLASRAAITEADITTLGLGDGEGQLPANHYDWVIMNPPFNEAGDRASPHETKAAAHVMDDALFNVWLKKAASVLHAKGRVALIARPSSLNAILAACERRFGGLRIIPLYPSTKTDALRILVIGQKGSKKRLALANGLVLRTDVKSDAIAPDIEQLINGQTVLEAVYDQSVRLE